MKKHTSGITIEIMGKEYQIKCAENDVESLYLAAEYLEDKMNYTREVSKVISIDRVAVISALNISHELITLKNQINNQDQSLQQRYRDLQTKVDGALARHSQMELESAE